MKPKKAFKSVEDRVLAKVVRRGRGCVFFGVEFLDMGRPDAVRQALSRLARAGTIRRIGTSLYHYPAINDKLGGELQPSADAVARAIARRTDSRIVATGALAANLLGLSTQVPAKLVYLTNGPSRSIAVGSSSLSFRHVSPRRMAARWKISAMVFEALRYLKQGNVTEEVVTRLRRSLPVEAKAQLHRDLRHAAIWMRPLLERIMEAGS
jgi:hypothetical protein